jgi:cytochrome c551
MSQTERETNGGRRRGRLLAIGAAAVIPAALAILFWRTTPIVGGWGGYAAGPASGGQGGVDYTQNGRIPVDAGSTDPKVLYGNNCASCHGSDLKGKIGPALVRPGWPYAQNRDLLIKVIHEGRGLTMPGFDGRLSNQQIQRIADYIEQQNAAK